MVPSDEIKKLSELTSLITKGSTPTTYGHPFVDESKGGATFIGAYNCSFDGTAKLDTKKWITSEANEMLKRSKLSDQDSILCIVGNTIGSSFMVDPSILPANINQNVAVIRPDKEKVFPLYLKYAIRSAFVQWQVIQEASTQAQPSLSLKQVGDFRIFIPPLSEQRKIAAILSTWDKAISTTEQLLANSQQQKKALMQQLLTGKKRLLDENGERFRGEWKTGQLSDLAKITKGKALSSKDLIEGDFPVIAGGKTSPYKHKNFTHQNVITVSASGAYAGYVAYHNYKLWASDCSVVDNKVNSDINYIYQLMTHLQTKIYSLQSGGAQPHVYPKDLEVLKVAIPSLKEQQKIAAVLTAADAEISALKQKIEALKQEKKALIQQLLTSKRRVKVDEVAA